MHPLLRRILLGIFRLAYRLEVDGLEHLAAGQTVVIAPNHVSFLDPAFIRAVLECDPVFAIDTGRARAWWVRPFLHFVEAYTVDPARPMAIRRLVTVARSGRSVVIFPEGRLTVTGRPMKAYAGAAFVARKAGIPILPVHITGEPCAPFTKLPRALARRHWFPRVRMSIRQPVRLPGGQSPGRRRQSDVAALQMLLLEGECAASRADIDLLAAVAHAAWTHGSRRAVFANEQGTTATYRSLQRRVQQLQAGIEALTPDGATVGLRLSRSADVAAGVLATLAAGRVPALVGGAQGAGAEARQCDTAKVALVVTQDGATTLDTIVTAGAGDAGRLVRSLNAAQPASPSPALIVADAHAGGCAVVLSHQNLLSNAAQFLAMTDINRTDIIFSALPRTGAVGFMCGVMLPLISGACATEASGSAHPRLTAEAIYVACATVLFATGAQLAALAAAADAFDLRTLRLVFSCDGPVDARLQQTFHETFGIRILPCVTAPQSTAFVAASTPMFYRAGASGRLMPSIDIVPRSLGTDVATALRGPNVALGRMLPERPGEIVPLDDGLFLLGRDDVVDADGFVAQAATPGGDGAPMDPPAQSDTDQAA